MFSESKGGRIIATRMALMATAILIVGLCAPVQAQRLDKTRTMKLIERLETAADSFSRSADAALDRSSLDDSRMEDRVNALVDEFEFATDRLRKRVENETAMKSDLEEVLTRALPIEMFMERHKLAPRAQADWNQVKAALNALTQPFDVVWVWKLKENPARENVSMRKVINRVEHRSDEFRDSFDDALDRSPLNGTEMEDRANFYVKAFEQRLDSLEGAVNDGRKLTETDVKGLLDHAMAIEAFMSKHQLSPRARRDWSRVKVALDDLAMWNNVAWVWVVPVNDSETVADARRNPNEMNANEMRERAGANAEQRARGERVATGAMTRSTSELAREIRKELLSELPYYGVFDWIEFDVRPDNTVVLEGFVTSPPDTKSRAESVVEDLAGVERVVNNIEVLPVSPNDDRLRRELYREIYSFNSPLFKYSVGSRQSIHIIVKNGRAWLKGIVDTEADKNMAAVKARSVSGLFEVNNDLRVDRDRRF